MDENYPSREIDTNIATGAADLRHTSSYNRRCRIYKNVSWRRNYSPEGSVKQIVNNVLACYPEIYVLRNVAYGYGNSTLDYLVCHYGKFIGIETKAPGKKPTDRQRFIIGQIERAGGEVFIIDGTAYAPLQAYLEQVKQDATSTSQPQTPDGGSTVRRELSESFSGRPPYGDWERFAFPPAAPADRDLPVTKIRVRRAKLDPDSL